MTGLEIAVWMRLVNDIHRSPVLRFDVHQTSPVAVRYRAIHLTCRCEVPSHGGYTPLNHNKNVLCVILLFKKTTIKNSTLAKLWRYDAMTLWRYDFACDAHKYCQRRNLCKSFFACHNRSGKESTETTCECLQAQWLMISRMVAIFWEGQFSRCSVDLSNSSDFCEMQPW